VQDDGLAHQNGQDLGFFVLFFVVDVPGGKGIGTGGLVAVAAQVGEARPPPPGV
jgi:hypothetical protein